MELYIPPSSNGCAYLKKIRFSSDCYSFKNISIIIEKRDTRFFNKRLFIFKIKEISFSIAENADLWDIEDIEDVICPWIFSHCLDSHNGEIE